MTNSLKDLTTLRSMRAGSAMNSHSQAMSQVTNFTSMPRNKNGQEIKALEHNIGASDINIISMFHKEKDQDEETIKRRGILKVSRSVFSPVIPNKNVKKSFIKSQQEETNDRIKHLKGGIFRRTSLKEPSIDYEGNQKLNAEIKLSKALNVFKKGITPDQYTKAYKDHPNDKMSYYLIGKKSNLVPKKKPYIFEFNYEQRKLNDPLKEFKSEFIDQAYRPVEAHLRFYNSKNISNLMKQVSVSYKSKSFLLLA